METHSGVLSWRIPGKAGPGGLPSMGSHRVGHNWSDLAAVAEAYSNIKLNLNIYISKLPPETWLLTKPFWFSWLWPANNYPRISSLNKKYIVNANYEKYQIYKNPETIV